MTHEAPFVMLPWPLALGPANVRAGLTTFPKVNRIHSASWHINLHATLA
jgi:hypothetical protein